MRYLHASLWEEGRSCGHSVLHYMLVQVCLPLDRLALEHRNYEARGGSWTEDKILHYVVSVLVVAAEAIWVVEVVLELGKVFVQVLEICRPFYGSPPRYVLVD